MKPNASHKPNHDPSLEEIAAMKQIIRDENEAEIMAKAPADWKKIHVPRRGARTAILMSGGIPSSAEVE